MFDYQRIYRSVLKHGWLGNRHIIFPLLGNWWSEGSWDWNQAFQKAFCLAWENTSCGTGSKPATRHVWGWTSLYLPTILWFTRDSMCFDSYPWGSSQSVSDGSSFRTGKIVDRISTRGLLYHVSKQHVSKCCPLKSKYCGSSRTKKKCGRSEHDFTCRKWPPNWVPRRQLLWGSNFKATGCHGSKPWCPCEHSKEISNNERFFHVFSLFFTCSPC